MTGSSIASSTKAGGNGKFARRLALVCAALALHAAPAYALSADSDDAPPHIAAEITAARCAGQGTYRWFGIKIYDARLWVGKAGYQSAAPAMTKFALDLRYARTLYGKKIAAASIAEIRALGLGTAAQQENWLAGMERLFPDVAEGSRITGVFLPDAGVRFYLDGKILGELPDPQFGTAFFAIWLDPKTSAAGLRGALLADAAPR